MRIKEKKIKKLQRKSYLQIEPDPKHKSKEVSQFINYLMQGGKKDTARKIVYGAFDIIKKKMKQDPVDVFKKAVKNASPSVEVKAMRIGGATYQVPREVKEERGNFLAMNWIIKIAKSKKGKLMEKKLADEIISSSNKEGEAVKKKQEIHKMAEANKAFAHFAK